MIDFREKKIYLGQTTMKQLSKPVLCVLIIITCLLFDHRNVFKQF